MYSFITQWCSLGYTYLKKKYEDKIGTIWEQIQPAVLTLSIPAYLPTLQ